MKRGRGALCSLSTTSSHVVVEALSFPLSSQPPGSRQSPKPNRNQKRWQRAARGRATHHSAPAASARVALRRQVRGGAGPPHTHYALTILLIVGKDVKSTITHREITSTTYQVETQLGSRIIAPTFFVDRNLQNAPQIYEDIYHTQMDKNSQQNTAVRSTW
ncbi:Myopalladin, partial [Frankliniella fusca]